MNKCIVNETQPKNRLYSLGEEITFVNQFSHMISGVIIQDCGRFIVVQVRMIEKGNQWVKIKESYCTTLWKRQTEDNQKKIRSDTRRTLDKNFNNLFQEIKFSS